MDGRATKESPREIKSRIAMYMEAVTPLVRMKVKTLSLLVISIVVSEDSEELPTFEYKHTPESLRVIEEIDKQIEYYQNLYLVAS